MTLIEIMISTGLAGLIMVALMFLLYQSGKLGGKMNQTFDVVEGAADAVSQFSAVIPETTRITSCLCQGNTSTRAACVWNTSNPWYDPVYSGGATNGSTILAGEFEAYNGVPSASFTSLGSQVTSAISVPGESCGSSNSTLTSGQMRGCKLSYQLKYTAPTNTTAGGAASNAGQVYLKIGSNRGAGIGYPGPDGARGLGVVKFACGFDNAGGGTAGSVFVLNMLLKVKSNLVVDTNNMYYEKWYPDDTSCTLNYCKGTFKEIQLKYTMRNLTTRGAYFWRPESIKNCVQAGKPAASIGLCCSGAWDGTNCVTCLPSGSAGTNNTCCSQQASGGVCT